MRQRILLGTLAAALVTCCGCERAPSVEIMGAFFPSWLVCVTTAAVLVVPVRGWFLRLGWDPDTRSECIVYPCLMAGFACLLWLLLFR